MQTCASPFLYVDTRERELKLQNRDGGIERKNKKRARMCRCLILAAAHTRPRDPLTGGTLIMR